MQRKNGTPLVRIINALSDPEALGHLIIKRRWRTVLPKWRELNAVTKDLLRHCALHQIEAFAFSLNLGEEVLATHGYGDVRSRNSLRNRIAKELREEFKSDVPFTFTIEADSSGRLHLHGSVGVAIANRERVKNCLKKAGGKWAHSGGQAFQIKLENLYNPAQWHAYLAKEFSPSDPVAAKRLVAKSRSADRLAKALYDEMLQFLQDHAKNLDVARVGYLTSAEMKDIRHVASFFDSGRTR